MTKRLTDLTLTILAMPVWLPVLLGGMAAVLCTMGRPVFYVSKRAGKGGEVFNFWKLRTMREGEGSDGERLTKTGRILRKLSIDEFPQLFLVLAGKMSLVGPRPLPERYLTRYTKEQMRRHEVLPGITGWAQVNGRNSLEWEEKFALDVWYTEHQSWALDMKILMLTIKNCVNFTSINHPKYDTMVEFKGENHP